MLYTLQVAFFSMESGPQPQPHAPYSGFALGEGNEANAAGKCWMGKYRAPRPPSVGRAARKAAGSCIYRARFPVRLPLLDA